MSEQKYLEDVIEDRVRGYVPLDLESCKGFGDAPIDYEIDNVMGDIICLENIDEAGEGLVNRGGVLISEAAGTKAWRVGKVLKVGPMVSKTICEGTLILYPNDKGVGMVAFGKKKVIFLNESRIFATLKAAG